MMSIPFQSASRFGAPLLLAVALPVVLAGCEAEAVELAQDIAAARGDCTAEALRRSDEECVEMMERYTEMGTDLVHTYIGGLKALDMALDRMPPVEFDTTGLGYAISPELRAGDPFGDGASPRVSPAGAAYSSLAVGPEGEYDRLPQRRAVVRPEPRENGGRNGYGRPVDPRPERDDRRAGQWRAGRDRADRFYDRRGYERFGYGARDWWGYGDAYRYLESGPEGYFNSGPYDYFYQFPYGSDRTYGYGSGYGYDYGYRDAYLPRPAYGYGYDDAYGYGGRRGEYGYAYDDAYEYGYRPRGGYGYGYDDAYGGGYGPRGGYGYEGYAPYDYGGRYAPRAQPRDPYGFDSRGYELRDPTGAGPSGSGYRPVQPDGALGGERTPAEEWGYDPIESVPGEGNPGSPRADDSFRGAAAAPGGPAPRRPGILLPPEERLRRPWLDD